MPPPQAHQTFSLHLERLTRSLHALRVAMSMYNGHPPFQPPIPNPFDPRFQSRHIGGGPHYYLYGHPNNRASGVRPPRPPPPAQPPPPEFGQFDPFPTVSWTCTCELCLKSVQDFMTALTNTNGQFSATISSAGPVYNDFVTSGIQSLIGIRFNNNGITVNTNATLSDANNNVIQQQHANNNKHPGQEVFAGPASPPLPPPPPPSPATSSQGNGPQYGYDLLYSSPNPSTSRGYAPPPGFFPPPYNPYYNYNGNGNYGPPYPFPYPPPPFPNPYHNSRHNNVSCYDAGTVAPAPPPHAVEVADENVDHEDRNPSPDLQVL